SLARSARLRLVATLLTLAAAGLGVAGYAFAGRGLHTHGAHVAHFQLRSADAGRTLAETAVIPRDAAPRGHRPLLVLLHWRGGTPDMLLSNELFAGLARLGTRAPLVVMPKDDGNSFFHNRRDGRWADYVVHDVIPAAVRRFGADPS